MLELIKQKHFRFSLYFTDKMKEQVRGNDASNEATKITRSYSQICQTH